MRLIQVFGRHIDLEPLVVIGPMCSKANFGQGVITHLYFQLMDKPVEIWNSAWVPTDEAWQHAQSEYARLLEAWTELKGKQS